MFFYLAFCMYKGGMVSLRLLALSLHPPIVAIGCLESRQVGSRFCVDFHKLVMGALWPSGGVTYCPRSGAPGSSPAAFVECTPGPPIALVVLIAGLVYGLAVVIFFRSSPAGASHGGVATAAGD